MFKIDHNSNFVRFCGNQLQLLDNSLILVDIDLFLSISPMGNQLFSLCNQVFFPVPHSFIFINLFFY